MCYVYAYICVYMYVYMCVYISIIVSVYVLSVVYLKYTTVLRLYWYCILEVLVQYCTCTVQYLFFVLLNVIRIIFGITFNPKLETSLQCENPRIGPKTRGRNNSYVYGKTHISMVSPISRMLSHYLLYILKVGLT